MSITSRIDMHNLNNEIQDLVLAEIDEQLRHREDVCVCETCILDMVCYAMNNLQPRYSVSLLGSLYSRAESEENKNQVKKVVEKAIGKISRNPAHGE